MAQGSSLPPLKTNKGKYGIIILFLLGTCGAGWLIMQRSEEKQEEAPEVVEAPPVREQFKPEIEIPEPEPEEGTGGDTGEETRTVRRERKEPVECTGSLSAGQIRDAINGAPRKQVQTCYEQRLKDNNLLQGQMTVLITIAQSGGVRHVSVSGSLRDQQVYSCVRRVARSWKFPRPDGGCVRTAVPFTLTPKL